MINRRAAQEYSPRPKRGQKLETHQPQRGERLLLTHTAVPGKQNGKKSDSLQGRHLLATPTLRPERRKNEAHPKAESSELTIVTAPLKLAPKVEIADETTLSKLQLPCRQNDHG
jgi:hypothetical protein